MLTIEMSIHSILSQKLAKVHLNAIGAFIHRNHKSRKRGKKKTGTFSHASEALLANLQSV